MKKPRPAFSVRERIGATWPRTLCFFDVGGAPVSQALVDGVPVPFQRAADGRVGLFLDLPASACRSVEFAPGPERAADASPAPKGRGGELRLGLASGSAVLPAPGVRTFDPPADSLSVPPPILRFETKRGTRLGRGFLDTYERVVRMECAVVERGPLWTSVRIDYAFDNGASFRFECAAAAGEDFLRIRESADCGPKSRWGLLFDAASGFLPDGLDLADHTLFHESRRLDYFADRLHARLYPWTQGTQIAALREGLMAHSSATGDTIGWFARADVPWDGFKNAFVEFRERRLDPASVRSRGGETEGGTFSFVPSDATGTCTDDVAAFSAESILREGSGRSYAIFLGRRRAWHCPDPAPPHTLEWYEGPPLIAEWDAARSPLRRRIQLQGLLSLDIVKDWTLDVAPDLSACPAIAQGTLLDSAFDGSLRAMVDDLPANAGAILRTMSDRIGVLSTGFVMGRGPGGTNPVTLRCAAPFAALYARMLREGLVPPDVDLVPHFLFLAHLESREASYPGELAMAPMSDPRSSEPVCLGMPNENFLTDVYCVFGGIAAVFPKHPLAAAWAKRADRLLGLQLDVFSNAESGAWEESHTYFNHVLRTLALYVAARRAMPEGFDWCRDPRFRRLCRAALHFVTPRDPNAGGLRMMATLGDHRMELHWATGNSLAQSLAGDDRTLARNLAWLSVENGWKGEPCVPPLRPRLVSHLVQGQGAVLRGAADRATGGESMLLLRAGAEWGHCHCDELEVLYWCGGEPVLCEAGYGDPKTFPKVLAAGHSVLHPADFTPAFYLSKATRGRVDRFEPGLPGDVQRMSAGRVVAFEFPRNLPLGPTPVKAYAQRRTLEWVERGADGTATLRVIDEWDGDARQRLQFHTGGRGVEAQGRGRLLLHGHRLDTRVSVSVSNAVWEIQPDACGFTTGFALDIPAGAHRVVTTFSTRLGSGFRGGQGTTADPLAIPEA